MNANNENPSIINENYEYCPPKADAMIHSLRAFGYDLGMAIADLIDNSIFAKASNIWIGYCWNDGEPWVRIMDDGRGMTEQSLVDAMTLGSTSPLDERDPADLGRFGLGLKTASFSQCKLVAVSTKTSEGTMSTRFWDLDFVERSKEWNLGKIPSDKVKSLFQPLEDMQKGTVVVWNNLDRISNSDNKSENDHERYFLMKFLYVKEYLEMVFHQYLDGKNKIRIFIGSSECKPWDPFLKKNSFTNELSAEKYEDKRVSISPFILPHISNRSDEENEKGGGPKGWNAQQGFYVYRNKRMIVSGGYLDLDLKAEEHYKLARIKIDITNDMDHEWSIDVRKAVASPPDRLKAELLRIARATRQKASDVYRARIGGGGNKKKSSFNAEDVWLKIRTGEKIAYKLNLNNPVLRHLLTEVSPKKEWIKNFCHLIETTVPHRLIIMDGLEHEDCHVDIPRNIDPPPDGLLDICRELYSSKINTGYSHDEAADSVCCVEPFSAHPTYRAMLDGLIERQL